MQSSNRKNSDQTILEFGRLGSLEWEESGVQPDYEVQLLIDGLDAAANDPDAERKRRQKHEISVRYLKYWRAMNGRQLLLFDNDSLLSSAISPSQPSPSRSLGTLESLCRLFSIFMSQDQEDAFVGDLEERYVAVVEQKGYHAAKLWFWREVAHSFIALALDALKKCSGVEKVIERCRRIGS